jgi:protein-disulfide isomerase
MNRSKWIVEIFILLLIICTVFTARKLRPIPPALTVETHKTKGPADAPVTIFLFTDFACPYCNEVREPLETALKAYPTELKLVLKHYPLKMHKPAKPAAEASECAAEQGAFWPYHDLLFKRVDEWYGSENLNTSFTSYAESLGLKTEAFRQCLESHAKKEVVDRNIEEGNKYFIQGTPTCIINGRKVLTRNTSDYFIQMVEEELAYQKKG